VLKRSLLWLVVSSIAVLLGSTAAGRVAPDPTPLAAHELHSVTGAGCVSKCDDDSDTPPEPYVLGYEWRVIKRVDQPVEQLSYSIVTEFSNTYTNKKLPWEVSLSDNCRYRWTTGGLGISTGFNVNVGVIYHCSATVKLSGTLDPGWRVKIYKGEMRQVSTVTMGLFEVYSDGTAEDTRKRDTGRLEQHWTRFTPVTTKGN
jgi:hypothetical protein